MKPPPKFCILPFTHLNLKPQGRVACCWRQQGSLGNYYKSRLGKLWQGDRINEIREEFLKDQLPSACNSCSDMESKGVQSTRQRLNELHSFMNFEEVIRTRHKAKPYSIEVRFSNLCNLACKHCNPQYSSNWFARYKDDSKMRKLYLDSGFYDEKMLKHFDEQDNQDLPKNILEEIITDFAPHLKHIVITGGEPLLQPNHFAFLKKILPYAPQITLDYNSNLTTLGISGESVVNLWPAFKAISLRASIDGPPEVYAFLRHSHKIKSVEKNIAILQDNFSIEKLELFGTLTTSLYNILSVVETVRYFNQLGVLFHASLVQYPKFLRITVLPPRFKKIVTEKVESFLSNLENDFSWSTHPGWLSSQFKESNINHIRHHLRLLVTYMNSADESRLLPNFVQYNKGLEGKSLQHVALPSYLSFEENTDV